MGALLIDTLLGTLVDVVPIVAVLFGFQVLVLRRRVQNLGRILIGFVHVILGLTLFLVGLEEALFPLGEAMALQLTDPAFLGLADAATARWHDYGWVYLFAALIGFATTIAEPSLIAVSLKAEQVSGGGINAWGLRLAVAFGVGVGVALGAFRIITGSPLPWYIMGGYVIIIIQTWWSRQAIIPLAYDTGGVTTSTVTVPVVTALGLGLAATIPGRSPLIDGFGMIAFACGFPIISVLGYAMLADWLRRRRPADPPSESGTSRD